MDYRDNGLERIFLCNDNTFSDETSGVEQELLKYLASDALDAVLDFTGMKRINSRTLALLIRVKKKYTENGKHLGIINANDVIVNVINIAGLKSFLLEN